MMAAMEGKVDYVEMLLDAKADTSARLPDGSSVWSLAVQHNRPELLSCLFRRGFRPQVRLGCDGETILLQAVRLGKLRIVQSLLQGGVVLDADAHGVTPLMEAVCLGREDMIYC